MTDHLRDFQQKLDKLEATGILIPDELISIMLLNSLPEEYASFCIAMEARDCLPSISVLKVKLLEEESRQSNGEADKQNGVNALLTNEKNKRKEYNINKKFSNAKEDHKKKFNGKCFNCNKFGHVAADCKFKKKNYDFKKKETCLMLANNEKNISDVWCLDSGASSHMCNDKSKFIKFINKGSIKIQTAGKQNIVEACGTGVVVMKLQKHDRGVHEICLNDVMYVPTLKQNLISVSKITEKGYVVKFNGKIAKIENRDGSLVMQAYMENNIYLIREKREISLFSSDTKSHTNYNILKWHQRFGHLNFIDLQKLSKENLVRGINTNLKNTEVKCITCEKGKMKEEPHKISSKVESSLLEIIHSDICGPFNKCSLGGSKYFATFIDSKSRFVEVVFLKKRSEILEEFKKYKKRVECQTGYKIKNIRTDNAKEYTSLEFEKFLSDNGIQHQTSIAYTPQQNGVAERMNRTLLDMARCMLCEANLPEYFWAEAINTAAFIRNRCPSSSINNVTPFELWTGKKPNVAFFKVFGSKAIALDKKTTKSKFQPKGKEYIFVGYEKYSKGYRLYDKNTRSIIKAYDVHVYEKVNMNNYFWPIIEEKSFENQSREETTRANNDVNEKEVGPSFNLLKENDNGEISDHDREIWDHNSLDSDHDQEVSVDQVQQYDVIKTPVKIKRGRPKILRTGQKGRPRIIRHEAKVAYEQNNNPSSIQEVMNCDDKDKWIEAIRTELSSLEKNNTWTLVERPKDKNILNNKWVFTIKYNPNGQIDRYKARLVAKGCQQKSGVDYDEVFAPVVRYETLRTL